MSFVDILGWTGAVAVIIAYGLNSNGKLKSDSPVFQILNLVGAVFLIIKTYYDESYPSMAINVIWTVIAVVALVKIYKK